jgi:hypothetical protein
MKLQKRIDKDKHTDIYVLYITHKEANKAFALMNDFEKNLAAELQKSKSIADQMKMLELWTKKIEEVRAGAHKSDTTTYQG